MPNFHIMLIVAIVVLAVREPEASLIQKKAEQYCEEGGNLFNEIVCSPGQACAQPCCKNLTDRFCPSQMFLHFQYVGRIAVILNRGIGVSGVDI